VQHGCSKARRCDSSDFYSQELRKHGRQIQMNYWVSQSIFRRYVEVLRRHFKTTSSQEAVVRRGMVWVG
jgi:hypothetical protein